MWQKLIGLSGNIMKEVKYWIWPYGGQWSLWPEKSYWSIKYPALSWVLTIIITTSTTTSNPTPNPISVYNIHILKSPSLCYEPDKCTDCICDHRNSENRRDKCPQSFLLLPLSRELLMD